MVQNTNQPSSPRSEVVVKGRITPPAVILPKLGIGGSSWIPAFAGMTGGWYFRPFGLPSAMLFLNVYPENFCYSHR